MPARRASDFSMPRALRRGNGLSVMSSGIRAVDQSKVSVTSVVPVPSRAQLPPPAVPIEVAPGDEAVLIVLDHRIEDLVRGADLHVHSEPGAEGEPFRAARLDREDAARSVDERMLRRVGQHCKDPFWAGADDLRRRNLLSVHFSNRRLRSHKYPTAPL